jgi:hypothetical protein
LAGAVFSRASIVYGERREAAVTALAPLLRRVEPGAGTPFDVCVMPDLAFVASWNDLGPTPFAPVAPNADRPNERLRLYRCADFRR